LPIQRRTNGRWRPIHRIACARDATTASPNTIIGMAQPQPLALCVFVTYERPVPRTLYVVRRPRLLIFWVTPCPPRLMLVPRLLKLRRTPGAILTVRRKRKPIVYLLVHSRCCTLPKVESGSIGSSVPLHWPTATYADDVTIRRYVNGSNV